MVFHCPIFLARSFFSKVPFYAALFIKLVIIVVIIDEAQWMLVARNFWKRQFDS